jgi:hypothetical protein
MKACIILHNMIVEDERESYLEYVYDQNPAAVITPVNVERNGPISFADFIENYHSMKDEHVHFQLRRDLIKHQWEVKGRQSQSEDTFNM